MKVDLDYLIRGTKHFLAAGTTLTFGVYLPFAALAEHTIAGLSVTNSLMARLPLVPINYTYDVAALHQGRRALKEKFKERLGLNDSTIKSRFFDAAYNLAIVSPYYLVARPLILKYFGGAEDTIQNYTASIASWILSPIEGAVAGTLLERLNLPKAKEENRKFSSRTVFNQAIIGIGCAVLLYSTPSIEFSLASSQNNTNKKVLTSIVNESKEK